jgi:hypothetical protein
MKGLGNLGLVYDQNQAETSTLQWFVAKSLGPARRLRHEIRVVYTRWPRKFPLEHSAASNSDPQKTLRSKYQLKLKAIRVWRSLLSGDFQVSELYILVEGVVDESSSTEYLLVPRSRRIPFADTNRIGLFRTHFTPSFRQRWQVGVDSSPGAEAQNPQNNPVELH